MDHTSAAEECFAKVVEALQDYPGVTPPGSERKFGSATLKVWEKIFAMLSDGKLVVKLPKARVDELVASGIGERFNLRRDGRLMKEWATVELTAEEQWLSLTREALDFVAARE